MKEASPRAWELEDEREILAAFRRGEAAALERVFRNYAPSVEALLRSGFAFDRAGQRARFAGLSSAFEVEDRVQEVFVRAFSAAGRQGYDGVGPYGAYLHGITRNLVLDEFRRSGRELLMAEPPSPTADPEGGASPTEPLSGHLAVRGAPELDAQDHELLEAVARYRAGLSARDRLVFELRYEQELDHGAIAARTGLSPSQIKTTEKHIRTTLFRHLQRHGYLGRYTTTAHGWLRWLRPGGEP